MRIFIALDIPPEIRQAIARFQDSLRPLAQDARWVSHESFHITLKFVGEQTPDQVERIQQKLQRVKSDPFPITFGGFGFFPTERAARVFWVGIEAPDALPSLAHAVDETVATVGIAQENSAFKPHLTLARAGQAQSRRGPSGGPPWQKGDAPNRRFQRIVERLAQAPAPEFGTMTATEFFLYESKLSPRGAQYTKLARFPLQA